MYCLFLTPRVPFQKKRTLPFYTPNFRNLSLKGKVKKSPFKQKKKTARLSLSGLFKHPKMRGTFAL